MSLSRLRSFWSVITLSLLLSGALAVWAQSSGDQPNQPPANGKSADSDQPQQTDPLKRPPSEKQKKQQDKRLHHELEKTYKDWLEKDVRWIITDEEREAFNQLATDEERDAFIEQFWLRRDPTPDTAENEYKEEHYRRITYANEHFASGRPGWMTDRGRIYIMYGPPDEIDSHPTGGYYDRPMSEGGGATETYPFETWRYRYLGQGVDKQEVEIEFVDTCSCNDYHMSMDPSEKDALLNVPGAGLNLWEQMGLANKADRFSSFDRIGRRPGDPTPDSSQFDRLELFAKLNKAPAIKYNDLRTQVSHIIRYNMLPFDFQADFVKVTSDTILVPITVQVRNKDLVFSTKEGVARGVVNVFGQVTTITGRIVQSFDDTVEIPVPAELLPKTLENSAVYWKALPLRPGHYKISLAVKDVNGDRAGLLEKSLTVPEYSDDKLATSSLILADQMEKLPTIQVGGSGNFVIGDTKVRPRLDSQGRPASFKKTQNPAVNFWMQAYNLAMDEKTHKPSATFQYEIVNIGNQKKVLDVTETTDKMGNVGEQVTLEKRLPMSMLEPGVYQLTIKVTDNVSKQTVAPTAKFTVE